MSDTAGLPWRTFQCTEEGAYKFWSVCVESVERGATQRVRFGRIGTEGQEQEKRFDSLPAAIEATTKLIKAKLNKGYAEVFGQIVVARTPKPKYTQLALFADEDKSDEGTLVLPVPVPATKSAPASLSLF